MLRGTGPGLLPDYQVAILDEAHTLEDVAAERLASRSRGRTGIDYPLYHLFNPRTGRGLLAALDNQEAIQQTDAARFAVDRVFRRCLGLAHPASAAPAGCIPRISLGSVSEELAKLATCVHEIAEQRKSEEEKIEYEAAAHRCRTFAGELRRWSAQGIGRSGLLGGGDRGKRPSPAPARPDRHRSCAPRSSFTTPCRRYLNQCHVKCRRP